jgi:integrase
MTAMRNLKNWTVKQCEAAGPGRHRVSESLYLHVGPNGSRRWLFRYTKPSTGKVTEMGLGNADLLTLAEARVKVHEARRTVAQGDDPIEQKRGPRAGMTFADAVADYLVVAEHQFRTNTVRNNRLLLLTHAGTLSQMPVSTIGSSHIGAALRPLWLEAPDQARRAAAAIIRVLSHASDHGHETASIGDLRERTRRMFPLAKGEAKHHAALDYRDIPAFVQCLRAMQHEAISPNAIEFILLTAARESEVCEMRWGEIDWAERVWTLPASRSKTNVEHQVPLSERAVALLARQRGPNGFGVQPESEDYVWPSRNGRGHLNGKSVYKFLTRGMGVHATVHGFRSSFRDYCGNETDFAREYVEESLAHQVGNAVERAYRRQTALDKRRAIMAAWSDYCSGK